MVRKITHGLPGLYIVFDGIIGCGKSEQISRLKNSLPVDFPGREFVFTYEPGGNSRADKIRAKVKNEKLEPAEEARLFVESRSITIPEIINPALENGKVVVSDRSFTTSLAYQGIGRGLGFEKVWEMNKQVVGNIVPDLVVWINVNLDVGLKRSGGSNPDKFDNEAREFWDRVVDGYGELQGFLQNKGLATKVLTIEDEGLTTVEGVHEIIKSELYPLMKNYLNLNREGVANSKERG